MQGHVNRGWLRTMVRAGFAKGRRGAVWVSASCDYDAFRRGRAYRTDDGIVHHVVGGVTTDYMIRGAK